MSVSSGPSTAPERSGVPVRVFIVDDQELVRHGLRSLLEQAGLDVVGECASVGEARRLIVECNTQVAVLNVHLPDGTGIEVCRDARAADAGLKCLMLTSYADDEALCSVVLAGAAGYVLRELHGHHIADAILRTADGEPVVAHAELARVKTEMVKALMTSGFDDLTAAEKDILALIAEDRDNRQISEALALDEGTVRDLVSALLFKLGFRSGTALAGEAPATPVPQKQPATGWTPAPRRRIPLPG